MIAAMRGVVLTFVLAAVGCHHPFPGEEAKDVCTVLCRCEDPTLPGAQAQCVDECTANAPADVPDACVTCVFEHETSCATLIGECMQLCVVQQPPTGGRSSTWQ
jgi:hypothetical protein